MGKILLILLAALVCAPVFAAFSVFLLSKRPRRRINADAIIVLGAKIQPDGTPSNTLRYRLDAARCAFECGYAGRIIVTGGQGRDENEPEASAMKRYLVREGIPADSVFEETTSKNTIENLKNAKAIMDEKGLETVLIATTDYHMDRALVIAKRLSVSAGALPARPGRKLSVRLAAYMREAASWCLLTVKILTGRI